MVHRPSAALPPSPFPGVRFPAVLGSLSPFVHPAGRAERGRDTRVPTGNRGCHRKSDQAQNAGERRWEVS
jgi:hypothetical protein